VGIFACCREIFSVTQHSGGISKAMKNKLDYQKFLIERAQEMMLLKLSGKILDIIETKKQTLDKELG
jgi:hypothetical protein